MPIIKVDAFECTRCGYIWLSRQYLEDKKTKPMACSKCKSVYWDREPIPQQPIITVTTMKNKKKSKSKSSSSRRGK